MPYIHQNIRDRIKAKANPAFLADECHSPGELNWAITNLLLTYINNREPVNKTNYDNINEVIGVLECCKLEFYRRLAAIYEDKKIQENGDVY